MCLKLNGAFQSYCAKWIKEIGVLTGRPCDYVNYHIYKTSQKYYVHNL